MLTGIKQMDEGLMDLDLRKDRELKHEFMLQ